MPTLKTWRSSRRSVLQTFGAAAFSYPAYKLFAAGDEVEAELYRPKIAAIITEYRGFSHADVIVGRFIQGYTLSPRETFWPRTRVVSMYVDQTAAGDLSRGMAVQAGAKVVPSIREALTLGGDRLAVDGVLIIGEHGRYPFNEKGQHQYPRRRFFEEAVQTFDAVGKSAPVFNDKGLGYAWSDAKWMYDQSQRLGFPLMAGSSLPLTFRLPDLDVPLDTEFDEVLAIGYGGLEPYGFHALETLQCMAERRRGGETGVKAVTCLEGPAVWQAANDGHWSRDLLDAVVGCVEKKNTGRPEDRCKNPELMLIEYADGLRGTVITLDGYSSAFGFAGRIRDRAQPVAAHFWTQEPGWSHFAHQVHNIESMYLTGKATYPAERTLLTTGILDAVMTSRFEQHRRIETPWLAEVRYQVAENVGRRAKL